MGHRVGVEEIEASHWVAWMFDHLGFTGKGINDEAAVDHLQSLLPEEELQVVERFTYDSSPEDPNYRINAFFEEDRRPLTAAEVDMAQDEMDFNRRALLAVVEPLPLEIRSQIIPGQKFESINRILLHVAGTEWWYCGRIDRQVLKETMPTTPLEALHFSRENTKAALPSFVDDSRTTTLLGETWSARKALRRILWHEGDHTQHIRQLLQEMDES
jgi:uncharacterized damage-inducible protein DinB